MVSRALPIFLVWVLALSAVAQEVKSEHKFDFAGGAEEFIEVKREATYAPDRGWGYELGTTSTPFYFSIQLPPGNYRVTVTLGDPNEATSTSVRAESRRLMLHNVETKPGEIVTRSFTVNIRTPEIPGDGRVKIKEREKAYLHWDDKLTLEFLGDRVGLRTLEVAPVNDATTVFLAGDSTVTDQANEPWNSWGQMLPVFFRDDVAVANHAESGESLKTSEDAGRLNQILASIKPGDYLFIQFGHNDMKDKAPGAGAFTSYKDALKKWVHAANARGANVVLVTSMHRRRFDQQGKVVQTLGEYPEAVRQVAKEENLPCIDLNEMSKLFYEALGPEGSAAAFQDGTHHNNYGSYELAKCVVEGIKANVPELAKHLVDDLKPFDPSKPDPVESLKLPVSGSTSTTKPDGN